MIRWIIKIILFPISLLLSILIAFVSFLLGIGTAFLKILSGMMVLISIYCLFNKHYSLAIEGIIFAFILSPYGLPMIGETIVGILTGINDGIRAI